MFVTKLDAGSSRVSRTIRGSRWTTFARQRISRLLLTLTGLIVATFLIVPLIPGDPVLRALGNGASPMEIEQKRAELGLDQPLFTQFIEYMRGLFTGDLGDTFRSSRPVIDVLMERVPASLLLGLTAFAIAFVLAVLMGFLVAVLVRGGKNVWLERSFTAVTSFIVALPEFFVAILYVVVFALALQWFPAGGNAGPTALVLPACALALGPAFALAKVVKVEAATILDCGYVLTARSKYLPERQVLWRHVFPNMLTASLAIGGFVLSNMLLGSVFVEVVFNWPGVGTLAVNSIMTKDYPLMQAVVLFYGIVILIITTIVDIAIALLNPQSTVAEV